MSVTLVQPYDPDWPSRFQQVAGYVTSGLADISHRTEHVGSTSIPGMMAKPIIDFDLVIPVGAFPEVKTRLIAIGYVHQGDLGIPEREAFDLANAEAKSELPPHYLYVCEDGVFELRKHIAFRDFMKQHPEWTERLNQLKVDLCVKHNNDRQAYINGKSAMVEEITRLAMTTPDVRFRRAERSDADGLHRNLFASKSLAKVTQDLLSDIDQMEHGRMIRVIGDYMGQPISNVQVYYSKNHSLFSHRAEIHTVHVSSEHRRKGIATAMLKHALGEAKHDRVEIATVWVDDDNVPAVDLYRKCGFSEFGRLDRGIKKPGGFSDYVLMKREL